MRLALLIILMAGFLLGSLEVELLRLGGHSFSSRMKPIVYLLLSAVACFALAGGLALAWLISPLLD